MLINWIIYTILAVGGLFSCCGGVLLFCRYLSGWCFLLPGVVTHIFAIVYTGVVIYRDHMDYCASEEAFASEEVLADLDYTERLYKWQVPMFILITLLANIGVKQDKVYDDEEDNKKKL